MSTEMHTADLGVVELPAVADFLKAQGIKVISGATLRDSAGTINTHIKAGANYPVLVADTDIANLKPWVKRVAELIPVVVIRTSGAAGNIDSDSATYLTTPIALDVVMQTLGLAAPLIAARYILTDEWAVEASPDLEDADTEFDPLADFGTDFDAPDEQPVAEPTVEAPAADARPWWERDGYTPEADATTSPDLTPAESAPEPEPDLDYGPALIPLTAERSSLDDEEFDEPVEVLPSPVHPIAFDLGPAAAHPSVVPVGPDETPEEFFTGFEEPDNGTGGEDFAAPWEEATVAASPVEHPLPPAPAAVTLPVAPVPPARPPVLTVAPGLRRPLAEHSAAAVTAARPAAPVEVDEFVPPTYATEEHTWTSPGGGRDEVIRVNTEDLFSSSTGSGLAPVIVTCSRKGGVTKTTSALVLAQRAADAGLNVIVVDANRGQGDIRSSIKVDRGNPKSIYQSAQSQNPKDAILTPTEIAQIRPAGAPPIPFGVILAPPPGYGQSRIVTSSVYHRAVQQARVLADLVVIDTQISEDIDESGLFEGMVTPLLASGGFALAVTDYYKNGVKNLQRMLEDFHDAGVPKERLLVAVTLVDNIDPHDLTRFANAFAPFGTVVGSSSVSTALTKALDEDGVISASDPAVKPLADAVLYRVTGMAQFAPPEPGSRKRRRLFGFGR